MRVSCTAGALRIRSLPVVAANTDTGRRMIKWQQAEVYGVSQGDPLDLWLYVDAPAGRGWCYRKYLSDVTETDERPIIEPEPSWPSVPNGRQAIYDLFGRPGSSICSSGRVKLPESLKIGWLDQHVTRFACHKLIEDVLISVFDQIYARKLWDHLKTFDGCYNDRTITSSQKVSTHAWGAAVDLNAFENRMGDTPKMNKTIVGIFEDHGFTWGGNWGRPDGMHFQYVRGY